MAGGIEVPYVLYLTAGAGSMVLFFRVFEQWHDGAAGI